MLSTANTPATQRAIAGGNQHSRENSREGDNRKSMPGDIPKPELAHRTSDDWFGVRDSCLIGHHAFIH